MGFGGVQPVIPDGPVDWIETDGNAYIRTGWTGVAPVGVRALVTMKDGDYTIVGCRKSGENRLIPIAAYNKKLAYGYFYYYSERIDTSDAVDGKIPVIIEGAFKSGEQRLRAKPCGASSFAESAKGTTTGGVSTSAIMYILANNNNGSIISKAPSGVRIHYLKLYSNFAKSTLVFDGIPYKYNGKFGLWDRVSNEFKGNYSSSGTIRGGMYEEAPYTEVDYIQTDGTAYIDTGVLGDDPKSMELKFVPAGTTNNIQVLLGTTNGSENADTYMPVYLTTSGLVGIGHYYFYSSGGPNVTTSITNQTPVIVKAAYKKSSQVLQVKQSGESDFTTFSKTQSNEIQTNASMYLFAANSPSNSAGIRNCLSGTKLYYCKIYGNDGYTDLIFDGVPCLYNGEYGLWDKVTNSFFGNIAGSGAFSGPQNS